VRTAIRAAICLVAAATAACGPDDLGECDMELAEEIVYGPNGWAATKGQALAHDGCSAQDTCHASTAQGAARWGAPEDLDLDMVPTPTGWESMMAYRYEAWEMVRSGDVPATAAQAQLSIGDWKFSPGRESDAEALPSIFSFEGKAAFRNWLACGAPVVGQPPVRFAPRGEDSAPEPVADAGASGAAIDWSVIFEGTITPRCALSGCHDEGTAAGELALVSECASLAVLEEEGPCGMPRLVPGDTAASFLMTKLESDAPGCGVRMPVGAPLSEMLLATIRAWIADGAPAENCR
jgi:hypothetical protein